MSVLPGLSEIRGELASRNLYEFVELMWPVLEPGKPFNDGIHIGLICDALEAVTNGTTRRLIINLPPRYGKSNLVSILWPAWVWARHPEKRWLFVSFAQTLAERHSVACRRLIESREYQQLYGSAVQLASDANQKARFENTRGGARLATSVGGAATGEGGDILVVDDIAKIEEATSRTAREAVIDFFDYTLSTRLNDRRDGAIVIVSQRLHERDLVGHLLDRGGYEHLCLPAEYDPQHPYLSPQDPRRAEGELLWPEQYDRADLEELKRQLGPYGTASQLQQLPAPHGGAIFPRDKWRWYSPEHAPTFDDVIISVDLAFTGGQHSDYCVAQIWGLKGADKYLIHQERAKLGFSDQVAMIQAVSRCTRETWTPHVAPAIYIEHAANAAALLDTLRHTIPSLIPVTPKGSKETRAIAISHQVHAGNIHLPGAANAQGTNYDRTLTPLSIQQLVDEAAAFPNAAHDDQVDALTQAITMLSRPGARLRVLG